MRFKSMALGLGLALASASLLVACGGGGGSSSTQVRLLNASVGYPSLALNVDSTTATANVAYATAGAYTSVSTSSSTTIQVQTSTGTTVASTTPTLTGSSNYTLIAYGWAGALKTTLLQETHDAPASGKSDLLVLNLAPDAGALDVYVTAPTDTLDNATATASAIAGGTSSGYLTNTAGTYRVRVTGAGSKTDLRLDIPSITLDSAGTSTLLITPSQGGVLVNGIQVKQKGDATNLPNALSRVRVVAALNNNAKVSATVNGIPLLASATAPTIGDYATFAAGASTLTLGVNGAVVPVTAPTLAVGGDYTLLVWGDSSAPQLSVLSDDNRLPVTSGTVKLRLINGVANLGANLAMTLDFTSVASNVAPGASSTPAVVNSSTTSQLSVTSPTAVDPVFSIPTGSSSTPLTLVANSVYTVFMMGDASLPRGQLKRER
ncbi:MAG: DUF4397 domain-containing protein [Burkholderiaceae bacterium]